MKKLIPILFLVLMFSALVPMVAAQSTLSSGCSSASKTNVAPPVGVGGSYTAGETISFSFAGAGTFSVTVDGSQVFNGTGGTSYNISETKSYTIAVAVAGGDGTSLVTVSCSGSDSEPDYVPGTICHYPPGNPANAHTINVGEAAVQTHISKHGDSEGPCPEEIDTMLEQPDINGVIFVLPLDGIIQFYSDCDDDDCNTETIIVLLDLFDPTQFMDEEGNFILVDEPVPSSEPSATGTSVVVYYLHPHPEESTWGVFQVNIFFDGVSVFDNLLLFISVEDSQATIEKWTNHHVWDLDDEDED